MRSQRHGRPEHTVATADCRHRQLGVALALAALIVLAAANTAGDVGALAWAAVFDIASLASLVATSLLAGLAIPAALLASGADSFFAQFLGLRD